MTTALDDLRVLDLGRRMAGALAGMVLADNGADVVKVVPPGGGPLAGDPAALVWDRGKRSVTLDLRTPAGRQQLLDLAAAADGVLHDWRPGAIEALGLGHHDLAAVHPGIVSVAISGFGERGPLRDLPGHEGIVAARTGRMATLNGYRDGPIFTPTPIASYGAAMLAVQGLLAALHARRRTGKGQRVHTSLLHALVSFDMVSGHGHRMHQPDDSGRVFGVMDLAFMTAGTADGRWIQMCSRQPHLFRNWLRALGLEHLLDEPGLADMPDVLPSRAELERVRELLAKAMRERTFDEWLDVFLAEDIGGDPFLTAAEYLQHPQAVENGRTAEVDDPRAGRTVQIGPLAVLSDTPSVIGAPAPTPGEHTEAILADPPASSGAPWRRPVAHPAGPRTDASAPPLHPLDGITVLEVGYFYAAPYAMTLLAEMGARVVKVEPPTGDPARRNWTTAYDKETVGKQSVVADMKTPEGLRIVHRLAERADVLLHNFRPGVPERLGIGYERMAGLNPRLIYVYGGAFGSKGPWARRPGFHSSPNAIAGSGIVEAGRGNPPINRTYADPASALATATATLLALHARELTGRGQYVETTMLSSMAYTVAPWGLTYEGKPDDPLPDQGQHGFHALHRLYPTADGWLYLECHGQHHAAALAEVLGLPAGALAPATPGADGDDNGNDAALAEAIATALGHGGAGEWAKRLLDAGVPAVRADGIDHLDFMLNDPHMRANDLTVETELADGTRFLRSSGGVELSAHPIRIGRPEPLGASTDAVLTELGYDAAAIADLHTRGITRAVGHGLNDENARG